MTVATNRELVPSPTEAGMRLTFDSAFNYANVTSAPSQTLPDGTPRFINGIDRELFYTDKFPWKREVIINNEEQYYMPLGTAPSGRKHAEINASSNLLMTAYTAHPSDAPQALGYVLEYELHQNANVGDTSVQLRGREFYNNHAEGSYGVDNRATQPYTPVEFGIWGTKFPESGLLRMGDETQVAAFSGFVHEIANPDNNSRTGSYHPYQDIAPTNSRGTSNNQFDLPGDGNSTGDFYVVNTNGASDRFVWNGNRWRNYDADLGVYTIQLDQPLRTGLGRGAGTTLGIVRSMQHTSAILTTQQRDGVSTDSLKRGFAQKYGRWEARLRASGGMFQFPAFWLWPDITTADDAAGAVTFAKKNAESDIWEILGHESRIWYHTNHQPNTDGQSALNVPPTNWTHPAMDQNQIISYNSPIAGSPELDGIDFTDFQTVGFEWYADGTCAWYVNNVYTAHGVMTPQAEGGDIKNERKFIILNHAIGSSWSYYQRGFDDNGSFNSGLEVGEVQHGPTNGTWEFEIDYVKCWQFEDISEPTSDGTYTNDTFFVGNVAAGYADISRRGSNTKFWQSGLTDIPGFYSNAYVQAKPDGAGAQGDRNNEGRFYLGTGQAAGASVPKRLYIRMLVPSNLNFNSANSFEYAGGGLADQLLTGNVESTDQLPNSYTGDPGDHYYVSATQRMHRWSGSDWIDEGQWLAPRTEFVVPAGVADGQWEWVYVGEYSQYVGNLILFTKEGGICLDKYALVDNTTTAAPSGVDGFTDVQGNGSGGGGGGGGSGGKVNDIYSSGGTIYVIKAIRDDGGYVAVPQKKFIG